jgi:hypothetical protein
MRFNEAPDQVTPSSPPEQPNLLGNRGVLAAALLAVAALGAPHQSGSGDRLPTGPTLGLPPGVPLPTPQRTQAPEMPYLPEERRLRETVTSRSSRPPKPPRPEYPPFRHSLQQAAVARYQGGIMIRQPRPYNADSSRGRNRHIKRSRGGNRQNLT